MPRPEAMKLSLSQETLRNLTEGASRTAGFAATVPHFACTTGFSCPECNPPGIGKE